MTAFDGHASTDMYVTNDRDNTCHDGSHACHLLAMGQRCACGDPYPTRFKGGARCTSTAAAHTPGSKANSTGRASMASNPPVLATKLMAHADVSTTYRPFQCLMCFGAKSSSWYVVGRSRCLLSGVPSLPRRPRVRLPQISDVPIVEVATHFVSTQIISPSLVSQHSALTCSSFSSTVPAPASSQEGCTAKPAVRLTRNTINSDKTHALERTPTSEKSDTIPNVA
ncbi:hypothetical protein BD310DRAFT_690800 [Dichomitus squalens]|uniref:Uncharacterized protein n=1 Tax=Dichomitus squalens TaxID=114155 RepID=A0A4Q9PMA9_9APHY|nr:hypothetical protein BD310DRAFT_690800 [Dichomitus squalens]